MPPDWVLDEAQQLWACCLDRAEGFEENVPDQYDMMQVPGFGMVWSGGFAHPEISIPACHAAVGQWAMWFDNVINEWRWVQVVWFNEDAPAFLGFRA